MLYRIFVFITIVLTVLASSSSSFAGEHRPFGGLNVVVMDEPSFNQNGSWTGVVEDIYNSPYCYFRRDTNNVEDTLLYINVIDASVVDYTGGEVIRLTYINDFGKMDTVTVPYTSEFYIGIIGG